MDSGATHSFILQAAVECLKLKPKTHQTLWVTIADEKKCSKYVSIFITKHRIFWVNLLHIPAGFTSIFLAWLYKRKPTLSGLVIQQRAFYLLGSTQLHANGWLHRCGLHNNTTTVLTLNDPLHIPTLLIGIERELYDTGNPIYDRVVYIDPIKAMHNLAQDVLAHITCHWQLRRAVPYASSK